ncbi:MAG: hypothetical protein A3G18_10135 [Rhodospirillales bacterium RIFCSPLOWO2_12_FULL_58_28]|nr:MAG: hypothetical protein A3H92_08310 [Rhodospirillales bacterium RIFCSPLOWO2_02_FULL_58_16]OHC77637.1 MAG: hypothetical protein A3G18_10135 [Rhodospirillales bacterium RIFCSPLOWO2_12_FULL_58_28]
MIRFYLKAAAAAVFWERLWPRLWPTVGVFGLFVTIALLDFLPRPGGRLHGLILLIFAAGAAVALFYGLRGLTPVSGSAARRRLETDSGLKHRPLNALEDRLGDGPADEAAATLWGVHLERMAEAARNLRLRLPAPGLASRDPYGLRALVLLFLAVGLAAAGSRAPERLKNALIPRLGNATDQPPTIEAWITPPAYTGRPPVFLGGEAMKNGQLIETPAGGALLARVGGAQTAPRLKLGGTVAEFKAIGQSDYRAETIIKEGERLSLEYEKREIAGWPLQVIPDAPPHVTLGKNPAEDNGQRLSIEYAAEDDYGVTGLTAIIRLSDGNQGELRLPLPLGKRGEASSHGTAVRDITAHPWAGLTATLRLEASDIIGQKGESGTVEMKLPERIFTHPTAKAIIAARKKLADPLRGGRVETVIDLDAVSAAPERFADDTVVYLALRVARFRLAHDQSVNADKSVQEILWSTALRLEDGGLSLAETALREAQEQLTEALRDGAAGEQIERLMDRLQQALNNYLAALAGHLKKQDMPPELADSSMRTLGGDDLQRLVDNARELARAGAVDGARQMLSQLQQILDDIQSGILTDNSASETAEARRLIENLRQLSGRQQRLLDDNFSRLRESRPKKGQPGQPDNSAAGQESLRRDLGQMMQGLGEFMDKIPRSLGEAELAMRRAVDELNHDRAHSALPEQSKALEELRRSMKDLGEQLAQKLGGRRSMMMAGPESGGLDPFGRGSGRAFGSISGSLKLPGPTEAREAREILKELHRRAGDQRRPKTELDYLERLLRRF